MVAVSLKNKAYAEHLNLAGNAGFGYPANLPVTWRVVAPQHRYALNEGNVVGKDFGPSAGFGVLSLHAQYNVSKTVQISVGVDNVLDKAYAEHLNLAGNAGFGYPANLPVTEPGRTAWVRLSTKL
ncbi:TonB-dependent copper receptor [Burkholderia pseudomallei]|nr:TonB-dependent copper receptor [Burkholderia pseudomallei]